MKMNNVPSYELVRKETLEGLGSEGYLLTHKKTGAKVVVVENQDENKVFTIGFRTPPANSTGVPHIIEHTVLCGSKNFPVKDPFVELIKGSLNTFINAMTYPDKTVYPVASCNLQDFKNLMHVYMDAVFYPNIYQHEEIFRQEGWTYDLENKDGELKYNGVVYNEMKGAFSTPESVMDRLAFNTIFKDTTYANESGGDPDCIPDLTYEEFLDFHRTYYHPSNSYIYLYGDLDMEERLNWLDEEYLSSFEPKEIDSAIDMQEPFEKMARVEGNYSITQGESEDNATLLEYIKVVGGALDPVKYLAFEVLDYALLSAPGAPLKQALLDAGIGNDISGSYDTWFQQPTFSIVAKNADKEQEAEFVKVIENTLAEIIEKGISPTALEAGLNYFEFRYREADYGNFPKGLMYGLKSFDSWLYDWKEPFMHIDSLANFKALREKITTGYFENLLKEAVLENQHGAVVVVTPKQGLTKEGEEKIKAQLAAYKNSLSEDQINQLVENTKNLKKYQEEEDSPEDFSRIPILDRSDITREVAPAYNESLTLKDQEVLFHEVDTNGIGYVSLLFDLKDIPSEDLPYVGILKAVLGLMDTENYSYGDLFNQINLHTGGIGTNLDVFKNPESDGKDYLGNFTIQGKALYGKVPFAVAMMEEILFHTKLSEEKRLKEILLELRSRLQQYLQSAGHISAARRAMSYVSSVSFFKDQTEGLGFYQVLSDLTDHFEERKEGLIEKLWSLQQQIFTSKRLLVSYTATKEGLDFLEEGLTSFVTSLPQGIKGEKMVASVTSHHNEGFLTASKVQYVAVAGNFKELGFDYTGALQILKVILGYEYLWQNIRVKGGAYGCMSFFNRAGDSYMVSYRDPNLKNTLKVYEGVSQYLKDFSISDRDMTKYIIGTISNMDQPLTPSGKGERSLNLYLNQVSKEMLQKERNEILDATQKDIQALSPLIDAIVKANHLCVVGGEGKIQEEKDIFEELYQLK